MERKYTGRRRVKDAWLYAKTRHADRLGALIYIDGHTIQQILGAVPERIGYRTRKYGHGVLVEVCDSVNGG